MWHTSSELTKEQRKRLAKAEKEVREARETAEAIAALPEDALTVYTDGGADGNGVGGVDGASGWGVSIKDLGRLRTLNDKATAEVTAEMWGPVVTDETDAFYSRCSRGTNNTSEMAGIIQALLWLKHVDKTARTAAICYDSEWAANMTQGKWTVKKRAVNGAGGAESSFDARRAAPLLLAQVAAPHALQRLRHGCTGCASLSSVCQRNGCARGCDEVLRKQAPRALGPVDSSVVAPGV